MKVCAKIGLGLVCVLTALASAFAAEKTAFIVEAESFGTLSGWSVASYGGQSGLYSESAPVGNAASKVVAPAAAGRYYVWACSYEPSGAAGASFQVYVNDVKTVADAKRQTGIEGWGWQLLGYADFTLGANTVTISALEAGARCDAVIFTPESSANYENSPPSAAARASLALAYASIILEAESFATLTGWEVQTYVPATADKGAGFVSRANILKVNASATELASTKVNVKKSGTYYIWASTYEFFSDKTARYYKVLINGVAMPVNGYGNFYSGSWRWLKLGSAELAEGSNTVALQALNGYARCDAILLTQDPNCDPDTSFAAASARTAASPVYKSALLEAESFAYIGDWVKIAYNNRTVLYSQTNTSGKKPMVKFASSGGVYYVWASTYEFSSSVEQFARSYYVYINGTKLAGNAYASSHADAWVWNNLGSVSVSEGTATLTLKAEAEYVRSDAVFVTQDPNFNPNASVTDANRDTFLPSYGTFIIECESFTTKGTWTSISYNSQGVLQANLQTESQKAQTSFTPPSAGVYYVWASTYEFDAKTQGTGLRNFKVSVNGVAMSRLAYSGLSLGAWAWTCLGSVSLDGAAATLSIQALASYTRADAILFTKDPNLNPNESYVRNLTSRIVRLESADVASVAQVGDGISWNFGWQGQQVQFNYCDDLYVENVWTYSAIGFGMQASQCKNISSLGVKFLAEGRQYHVGSRDAWKIYACRGTVDMQQMHVEGVRWDGQNVHGTFFWPAAFINSKTMRLENPQNYSGGNLYAGDKIGFTTSRADEVELTVVSAERVTTDGVPGYLVTFAEDIPSSVTADSVANVYAWVPDSYTLNNSSFKNIAGCASLLRAQNANITNSTFDYIMYPPICIGGSLAEGEGVMGRNISVSGNYFSNSGWSSRHGGMGAVVIKALPLSGAAYTPYIKNVSVTGNTVFNCPVGIRADGVDGLTINNNTFLSVTTGMGVVENDNINKAINQ